jgi:hypothetical protein
MQFQLGLNQRPVAINLGLRISWQAIALPAGEAEKPDHRRNLSDSLKTYPALGGLYLFGNNFPN